MTELSLATIDDMLQELEGRGLTAVLATVAFGQRASNPEGHACQAIEVRKVGYGNLSSAGQRVCSIFALLGAASAELRDLRKTESSVEDQATYLPDEAIQGMRTQIQSMLGVIKDAWISRDDESENEFG